MRRAKRTKKQQLVFALKRMLQAWATGSLVVVVAGLILFSEWRSTILLVGLASAIAVGFIYYFIPSYPTPWPWRQLEGEETEDTESIS